MRNGNQMTGRFRIFWCDDLSINLSVKKNETFCHNLKINSIYQQLFIFNLSTIKEFDLMQVPPIYELLNQWFSTFYKLRTPCGERKTPGTLNSNLARFR